MVIALTIALAVSIVAGLAGSMYAWQRGREWGERHGIRVGRAQKRREQYRADTPYPFTYDGEMPGLKYMIEHQDQGPPFPAD